MKIAAGIISIISGVFGIIAALATLALGGAASAFGGNGASTVVGLGWGGILFSFLVIIFGSICIGAKNRIPATLLTISAVLGIFLGGTFVALFMILGLVGGILALIGTKKKAIEQ
jgi:hypothetical protein